MNLFLEYILSLNGIPEYYNFLFTMILVWPALCSIIYKNFFNTLQLKRLLYLRIIILVLSFAHTIPFYSRILPIISMKTIENTNLFMHQFKNFQKINKNFLGSASIATLNIDLFNEHNVLQYKLFNDLFSNNFNPSDNVFYNLNDHYMYAYATKFNYKYKLKIENTAVRILTNENPEKLKQYFSNISKNDNFYLETLSNHEITNFYIKPKIKNLKHKLGMFKTKAIYLDNRLKYCLEMDVEKNTEIIWNIYKLKTKNLILQQTFSQLSNKFCFAVKETGLYYWTAASPLHSGFTINKLNFRTIVF